jgi:hypothetical protein
MPGTMKIKFDFISEISYKPLINENDDKKPDYGSFKQSTNKDKCSVCKRYEQFIQQSKQQKKTSF